MHMGTVAKELMPTSANVVRAHRCTRHICTLLWYVAGFTSRGVVVTNQSARTGTVYFSNVHPRAPRADTEHRAPRPCSFSPANGPTWHCSRVQKTRFKLLPAAVGHAAAEPVAFATICRGRLGGRWEASTATLRSSVVPSKPTGGPRSRRRRRRPPKVSARSIGSFPRSTSASRSRAHVTPSQRRRSSGLGGGDDGDGHAPLWRPSRVGRTRARQRGARRDALGDRRLHGRKQVPGATRSTRPRRHPLQGMSCSKAAGREAQAEDSLRPTVRPHPEGSSRRGRRLSASGRGGSIMAPNGNAIHLQILDSPLQRTRAQGERPRASR